MREAARRVSEALKGNVPGAGPWSRWLPSRPVFGSLVSSSVLRDRDFKVGFSVDHMLTYSNPVYPFYFADPFVWRYRNVYYAVGTGPVEPRDDAAEGDLTSYRTPAGDMAFPLLTSTDLATWKWIGGALKVPSFAAGGAFWAPEVAQQGEMFYMYYSVATEGLKHELRTAISHGPAGPFEDAGRLLADADDCPFAIDAHPFRDDDGRWYLFYARDFLDSGHGVRPGTALVVDELLGMTRLAGKTRVVLRARSDWQCFQRQREMYGRVFDWHTLEGPCVQKYEGRYFCFYSGGCYLNDTYGVDYGIADNVMGPYSDNGNESGPRVMKTVPGQVIGPGHQSLVSGPDGMTQFFVYHAWDREMTGRRMFIDPLDWRAGKPVCRGPTWSRTTAG